jgi:hypothetical protein
MRNCRTLRRHQRRGKATGTTLHHRRNQTAWRACTSLHKAGFKPHHLAARVGGIDCLKDKKVSDTTCFLTRRLFPPIKRNNQMAGWKKTVADPMREC